MAPRQPRKPVTMTVAPMAITMLAADKEGNEGEKVAKLPWDTESQMPTPSSPQPHNCKTKVDKVRKQTSFQGPFQLFHDLFFSNSGSAFICRERSAVKTNQSTNNSICLTLSVTHQWTWLKLKFRGADHNYKHAKTNKNRKRLGLNIGQKLC